MQNYKKLLFAGMAIVPLALSSWTSNDQNAGFQNGNEKFSNIEIIGNRAANSSLTIKTERKVISVSTEKDVITASESLTKTSSSLEPVLTFDKIVNDYK